MEKETNQKGNSLIPASLIVAAVILAGAWIYTSGLKYAQNQAQIQSGTDNSNQVSAPIKKSSSGCGV